MIFYFILFLFSLGFLFYFVFVFLDMSALFFDCVEGDVVSISIVEKNSGTSGYEDIWYDLSITYTYIYNNKLYKNSRLNGFNNVLRRKRVDVEWIISKKIENKKVKVFVCQMFPDLSLILPFLFNKTLFSFMSFMFVFVPMLLIFIKFKVYGQ